MANREEPLAVFETAFDTYEAWSVLGEGGAGKVFLATRSDGTEFALKALRPQLSSSDRRKRFKNEIDFLCRDRHKNIIRVVDSGVMKCWNLSAPTLECLRIADSGFQAEGPCRVRGFRPYATTRMSRNETK
jgi:hypothetical protein